MDTRAMNGNHTKKTIRLRTDATLDVTRKIPRSLFVLGNIILITLTVLVVYSLLYIKCTNYTDVRSVTVLGAANGNIKVQTTEKLPKGILSGAPVTITIAENNPPGNTTVRTTLVNTEAQGNNTILTLSPESDGNAIRPQDGAQPTAYNMRITTGTQSVFEKIFGRFY